MLRHCDLFNPIDQTSVMDDSEFTKYIEICKFQKGPTPGWMVEKIKTNFFDFAKDKVSKAEIKRNWDFIEPMLRKNCGLAQFTLDYRGDQSLYFFPWLQMVASSPARALEMSYGSGYDLSGNWQDFFIDDVDKEEDPINAFVRNDPTFVYNRQRQLYIADLACTVYDYARDSGTVYKIVDLGAGALAWARWHGYEIYCSNQDLVEVFAFDIDGTFSPYEFFKNSNLNVHYRKGDIMDQLSNPECLCADLIILSGVATYLSKAKLENLIRSVTYLLYDEGSLFFDLQLDCPYLQRSMKLWGWPEMNLPKDPAEAMAEVEAMRKNLWRNGYKYGAEYVVDSYNNVPSAIMVTMTRI